MRRLPRRRLGIAVLCALPLLFASPRTVHAQFVVFDPANLGQAVADQVTRVAQYTTQLLEYAEAVQAVIHLGRQIEQLDSTYTHMKAAAMGQVGQLTDAFADLASDPANLLTDAHFGSWRTRLEGTSDSVAGALRDMQDASLSDFLINELAAADVIRDTDLALLFPGARGAQLAQDWVDGRERGDRIRAADMAVAEAGGRLVTLLDNAQDRFDARRSQTQLSHTSLQQAQLANQLTQAEIDLAVAQLLAIQAQQAALARHEAELAQRASLARWVQREQDAQADLQNFLQAADQRRTAWRTALCLTC